MTFLIMILFQGIMLFANDFTNKPTLFWLGSADDRFVNDLAKNELGIKVRKGEKILVNAIEVRPSSSLGFLEIKNKGEWVTVARPASSLNVNVFLKQAIYLSSCDLIKTKIDLKESTPFAKIYFNSKPVGNVEENGRFFYESNGVCKQSEIKLLATMSKCKDLSTSFVAHSNPHIYSTAIKLKCKR